MDCGTDCCMPSNQAKVGLKGPGHIDTNGLAMLISSGVPLVILDARSSKWDDGKRISSAKTLTAEATPEQASKAIPSKQSLVVVYCSNTECGASSRLAQRLSELGYSNILKYEGGIQRMDQFWKPGPQSLR